MRLALMLCLTACLAAQPDLRHIAGSSRKIRMVVSNFYLRLSHDGRVVGTQEESSPEKRGPQAPLDLASSTELRNTCSDNVSQIFVRSSL
ncbi:unnamed protein product [Nezara viridula]|uniref:Neuropeptide n=1 Tax=Nezara viridula TaxID=85310 RepID=A0A9P0GZ25_NEZVI|nr:unnamed protein product [Nezara viridula]